MIVQVGQSQVATVTTTTEPTHMATTAHGGILGDFSSSSSKYLMRPAAEWKPSPFLLAMLSLMSIFTQYLIISLWLFLYINMHMSEIISVCRKHVRQSLCHKRPAFSV